MLVRPTTEDAFVSLELLSHRHRLADEGDAIDFCFRQNWSDGLPVVPPTEARVRQMLEAARLAPDKVIGFIPEREISITAEKVAINAVLAGCKPEYMPVVVAAVEGIADPAWAYHGPSTTTSGPAVLMIVNGPIARELDINSGENLFGPGWRANLTIGRAVRLVMRNVCGSIPGVLDRATHGHPGKLSYVIAENELESPWTPLHVDRGFKAEQNTVTVLAADGPRQIFSQLTATTEGVLTMMADDMRISGGVIGQTHYIVLLAGEHMEIVVRDGWTKTDVKRYLFENTMNTYAHLRRTYRFPMPLKPGDETRIRPLVSNEDMFFILPAGGKAGAFSSYIPGWAKASWSRMVTKEIVR
jgi:hypothetical protein